jgi:hypothetical protein
VAWDGCGCGGFRGYVWLDRAAIVEMTAWGRPRMPTKKGEWGELSQWESDDGTVLVLVAGSVRCGSHLT